MSLTPVTREAFQRHHLTGQDHVEADLADTDQEPSPVPMAVLAKTLKVIPQSTPNPSRQASTEIVKSPSHEAANYTPEEVSTVLM